MTMFTKKSTKADFDRRFPKLAASTFDTFWLLCYVINAQNGSQTHRDGLHHIAMVTHRDAPHYDELQEIVGVCCGY